MKSVKDQRTFTKKAACNSSWISEVMSSFVARLHENIEANVKISAFSSKCRNITAQFPHLGSFGLGRVSNSDELRQRMKRAKFSVQNMTTSGNSFNFSIY